MADAAPAPDRRLTPGSVIPLASTKYDGSLHYRYDVTVVGADDDELRAWAPAGTPMRSYRGDRTTSRHQLRVHPSDRWWNLEVHWEPDWRAHQHYVNIALPSTWDDGTLRFVDLDLDIAWWPDGSVYVLDRAEFAEHTVRFGYPRAVIDGAWAAVDEVRSLISHRMVPFDGTLYAWRPPGGDARA